MHPVADLGIETGLKLANGLGAVRENRDKRATKGAYKRRAAVIGGIAGKIKEPLLAGFAPGGFLRDALFAGKAEKAAEDSALALLKARSGDSRTSGLSRSFMKGSTASEALKREAGWLEADLSADGFLADFALSALGASTEGRRANPFRDYARGFRTWFPVAQRGVPTVARYFPTKKPKGQEGSGEGEED